MSRLSQKVKKNYLKLNLFIIVGVIVLGLILVYVQKYLTRSQAGVETSTATLNFIGPSNVTIQNEFDLTLNILSPAEQKISALDLNLKFDDNSDLVDFVSLQIFAATDNTVQYFNEPPLIQDVQQFGSAKVLHVVAHDQFKQNLANYSNNIRVVYRFKAKAQGNINFELLKNVSGVFGSKTASIDTLAFNITPELIVKTVTIAGNTVTSTPNPIATTTIAPTSVVATPTLPAGSTRVNLKARFQGIVKAPDKNIGIVKVSFTPTGSNSLTQEVNGTFTADGVWQGQTNVPLSQNAVSYRVYMQAPKYLKKRFCEKQPVATSDAYNCTDPRIILSTSENNLDFTGVYQLVGDTHAPFGVIDTVDIVSLRSSLSSRDAQKINLYDFNFNNAVEIQDYALVIKALSIQNTEDE